MRRHAPMANAIGAVVFWKNYERKTVLRIAQLAEDLGYDSIWIPEAWAYEQFQLLTEIACHTKRIKLATGIANVFSRSAGLLAMSAATLDEISEGRAILGLGTSGQLVIENFHGVPYKKPLTRLRETIGICKALWRGARLEPEMAAAIEAGFRDVVRDHGIRLYDLVLVKPGAVPRTINGKISRPRSRVMYEAGEFDRANVGKSRGAWLGRLRDTPASSR